MANQDLPAVDENAHDVEAVVCAGLAVAIDPAMGRLRERALLAVIDCFDRVAKFGGPSRFDLDERDEFVAFGDEIDVAAAGAEPAREDLPAALFKPAGRDALAEFAEGVGGFGHPGMVGARREKCVTESVAAVSEKPRGSRQP